MGPRFDETPRGRKFYDGQLPKLIKAIEENTAELKRYNNLKAAELKNKGVLCDEEPIQAERDGLHDRRDQVQASETFGRDTECS